MTKKLSPAIKAIKKIIRFAKNDKLRANDGCGCLYRDAEKDTYCAIGCLLPEKTLAFVIENGLNVDTSALDLYDTIPGLKKKIGLTRDQAHEIQRLHDDWVSRRFDKRKFISRLQQVATDC